MGGITVGVECFFLFGQHKIMISETEIEEEGRGPLIIDKTQVYRVILCQLHFMHTSNTFLLIFITFDSLVKIFFIHNIRQAVKIFE
jgi:hypothetical protein